MDRLSAISSMRFILTICSTCCPCMISIGITYSDQAACSALFKLSRSEGLLQWDGCSIRSRLFSWMCVLCSQLLRLSHTPTNQPFTTHWFIPTLLCVYPNPSVFVRAVFISVPRLCLAFFIQPLHAELSIYDTMCMFAIVGMMHRCKDRFVFDIFWFWSVLHLVHYRSSFFA